MKKTIKIESEVADIELGVCYVCFTVYPVKELKWIAHTDLYVDISAISKLTPICEECFAQKQA